MILISAAMPALAMCDLTGKSCSSLTAPSLHDKYVPNNLERMQKPDAFTPSYFKPYHDALINTESASPTGAASNPNYNSNCQFGVCLPGETTPEVMPEF